MSDFDDTSADDRQDGSNNRQDRLAYIGRHPALLQKPGAEETDLEFYRRREQEELVSAMSAPDPTVRDGHYALVDAYRLRIVELASGPPREYPDTVQSVGTSKG